MHCAWLSSLLHLHNDSVRLIQYPSPGVRTSQVMYTVREESLALGTPIDTLLMHV